MVDTYYAPNVVTPNTVGNGVLLVDTNTLITLQIAGKLDLLLRTNRQVVLTDQVFEEAIARPLESRPNPTAIASAQAIKDWFNANPSRVRRELVDADQ